MFHLVRSTAGIATLTAMFMAPAAICGPALAQEAPLGSSVRGLLEFARAQSPELAAMRLEAKAAQQRVEPAGAWPDPVLRVELMNINNYGTDAAPSLLPWRVGETRYTLMQTLPFFGKRGLRRDVAVAEARQADSRSDATWAELAARIKSTYAEYYRAAGNDRLTREVLDLLAQMEQVAQSRYAGGLATQQDAIRAQIEQTAMRSELISVASDKRQLSSRLNALLGREAGAALADPGQLRPLPAPGSVDLAVLATRVRASNPQLKAEQARLAAALKSRDLSLRNRYPDVQVGLAPTQMRSRITTWGLMFEVSIPLQQRTRRAQESEAETMVSAAQSRIGAMQNQLAGELGANLAMLDASRQTEALLQNQLLPQSQVSLRSAQAAYESGKLDFAPLLEAQRQIRKVRQDLLKTQAEGQLRLADIERILGEEL